VLRRWIIWWWLVVVAVLSAAAVLADFLLGQELLYPVLRML
jgi:hypothetical protein